LKPSILKINGLNTIRKLMSLILVIILLADHHIMFNAFSQEVDEEVITKIEIKGLRSLTKDYAMGKIRSREGSYFYPSIVKEDIKSLYATGHFSMINFETEKTPKGIILKISLVEKPVLTAIEFVGSQKIKEKDLKKKISSTVGSPADESKIKQDVNTIKNEYILKGFANVIVNYNLNIVPERNEATLKIIVDEGIQSKISKISFEGNKAFKDGELLKLMKTKKESLWPLNVLLKTGILDEEVFSEDLDRVENYYHFKGYLDAKITDVQRIPKDKKFQVVIKIEEGPTYNVGTVDIQGNSIFPAKPLRNLLESTPDTLYSPEKMEKDTKALENFYFDRGYIEANIENQVTFDSATGKMNIVFYITESSIFYVNKINLRGNYKTKDKVIRRELLVYPGEIFNGTKIKTGQKRLENTAFFEKVKYSVEDAARPGYKDLVYEVEEKKTGALSFGAGFSSIDSFVGFVEISQSNFDLFNFKNFQGAGQKFRVRFEGGDKRQDFLVSFVEPYLFDKKLSFGFDGFYSKSQYYSNDYDEDRMGVSFSLGKELGEFNRGFVSLTLEQIDIIVDDEASPELLAEDGTYNMASVAFKFDRDTRDRILFPTKGAKTVAVLKIAGGTESYTKFDAKRSFYFAPFAKYPEHTIQIVNGGGIVGAISGGRVPIFDRQFLGGPNTVRGFDYRELGPKDINDEPLGGKLGLWNSVEYQFPIIQRLYGAFFIDEGDVYEKAGDLDGDVNVGIGLGARLHLPIGPIKLDYGFPIVKDEFTEDDAKPRFHFSMGTSF